MAKLAIVTSHPIQYNAPFFRLLAKQNSVDLKVFYTWGIESVSSKFDPDFGRVIEWDIPLLEGYDYHFTRNVARNPGSEHFKGIITPDLIGEIQSFNPDIIWVWGWSFHSHIQVMQSFKGKIPIWFRGDSILGENNLGLKTLFRKIVLQWVYKHVEKAFSVGENNKSYYLTFGLKETQIIETYHAIDNERFAQITSNDELILQSLKEQLEIERNDYVILYAGKIEPRKNPGFLSSLAQSINNEKIKLIIVGNGPLESELKSQIAHLKHIKFLDFQNQSQMPIIYRLANLYILPSLNETWGLGMNEALACGVPVAASMHCGGAIDLINEDNGFIFNPEGGIDGFLQKLFEFRIKPKLDFRTEFLQKFNYQRIIDAVLKEVQ
jgi:glycosyltransferase involved in cell wall biosynthesis